MWNERGPGGAPPPCTGHQHRGGNLLPACGRCRSGQARRPPRSGAAASQAGNPVAGPARPMEGGTGPGGETRPARRGRIHTPGSVGTLRLWRWNGRTVHDGAGRPTGACGEAATARPAPRDGARRAGGGETQAGPARPPSCGGPIRQPTSARRRCQTGGRGGSPRCGREGCGRRIRGGCRPVSAGGAAAPAHPRHPRLTGCPVSAAPAGRGWRRHAG